MPTVKDGVASVVSQERLIKQIYFPKLVLPVAASFGGVVSFGFGLIERGQFPLDHAPIADEKDPRDARKIQGAWRMGEQSRCQAGSERNASVCGRSRC